MKSKIIRREKLESLVTKNDGTLRSKEEIMDLIDLIETRKKKRGRPDLINLINTARC